MVWCLQGNEEAHQLVLAAPISRRKKIMRLEVYVAFVAPEIKPVEQLSRAPVRRSHVGGHYSSGRHVEGHMALPRRLHHLTIIFLML